MPNKTIYVRTEDLPVFERAEKLSGDSLSAVIAEALKKFVERKDAEAAGLDEHTLQINNWEQGERTVKFVGRLLVADCRYHGQTSDEKDRWTDWAIYQTEAGKIIIFREHGSLWEGETGSSEFVVRDSLPDYDDEVFDYGETVPGSLLEEAAKELGQEKVEWVR